MEGPGVQLLVQYDHRVSLLHEPRSSLPVCSVWYEHEDVEPVDRHETVQGLGVPSVHG